MTLTQRITAVLLQREIMKRRRAQEKRDRVVELLDNYREQGARTRQPTA